MIKQFSLNEIDDFAKELVKLFEYKIILLIGGLGAGKTTLVKSIVKSLGCLNKVSSPTFGIVNELTFNKKKAFHLDLYRIENSLELIEIGFEDYINSGNYCFIEWPEIAEELITEKHHTINLSFINEKTRKIKFI